MNWEATRSSCNNIHQVEAERMEPGNDVEDVVVGKFSPIDIPPSAVGPLEKSIYEVLQLRLLDID